MPTKSILIKIRRKNGATNCKFFLIAVVLSCVRLQFNGKISDGIFETWDFCLYFCQIQTAFNKFKIMSEDRDSYEQMTDELEIQCLTIL